MNKLGLFGGFLYGLFGGSLGLTCGFFGGMGIFLKQIRLW